MNKSLTFYVDFILILYKYLMLSDLKPIIYTTKIATLHRCNAKFSDFCCCDVHSVAVHLCCFPKKRTEGENSKQQRKIFS